jgi:hypothetical protein
MPSLQMVVGQRVVAGTGKRICRWPNYVALAHLLLCEVDEVSRVGLKGLLYLEHHGLLLTLMLYRPGLENSLSTTVSIYGRSPWSTTLVCRFSGRSSELIRADGGLQVEADLWAVYPSSRTCLYLAVPAHFRFRPVSACPRPGVL